MIQIGGCGDDMSKEFDVHYGEEEFRTVDAGIEKLDKMHLPIVAVAI